MDTAAANDANGWAPGVMNGALGLALAARKRDSGFNLRQGPFVVKDFWSRHRPALVRTGMLAALVLVLSIGKGGLSIHRKARQAAWLDREITRVFESAFPEVPRVVAPLQQMEAKIREIRETALLSGLKTERPRAVDLLAWISRRLPAPMDVELTRLVIGPDAVTLAGHTSGFDTVDDIKTRLEQYGPLTAVTINAANIDKQSGRVCFTLTAVAREGE